MSPLMLINPRARTKKRRTAAQKAATTRMVAANRAKRGGKKHVAKRRSNPIGLGRVAHHARRAVSRVRHHVARRRNPIAGLRASAGGVAAMGMQAVQGASGALVINTALNYVPFLPVVLNSGNGKYLMRAAAAVALGVFGGKVLPKNVAHNMATGALTVALHDLLLGLAATAMPTARLGDVGDYDDGVSEYVAPAQQIQGMGDADAVRASGHVYDQNPNVGEYVGEYTSS